MKIILSCSEPRRCCCCLRGLPLIQWLIFGLPVLHPLNTGVTLMLPSPRCVSSILWINPWVGGIASAISVQTGATTELVHAPYSAYSVREQLMVVTCRCFHNLRAPY